MPLHGGQPAHRYLSQAVVDFAFPLVAVGVGEYLVAERTFPRALASAHVLGNRLYPTLVGFPRLVVNLLAEASTPEPATPAGEEPIKIPGRARRRDLRSDAQDTAFSGNTCGVRALGCLAAIPE
jgi:hypothetical protein